jgi:hypothetical protein
MKKEKRDFFRIGFFRELYKEDEKKAIEYIELFRNKDSNLDWEFVSWSDDLLSEFFMDKYQDFLYWNQICIYQTLSESFIEKHKDKVVWTSIFFFQTVSIEFLTKYQAEIDLELVNNIHLGYKEKERSEFLNSFELLRQKNDKVREKFINFKKLIN